MYLAEVSPLPLTALFLSLPATNVFGDLGFMLVFGGWPPDCHTRRSHLGGWPDSTEQVWRGFDRWVLYCPQMLFYRLGDSKSVFSLSL